MYFVLSYPFNYALLGKEVERFGAVYFSYICLFSVRNLIRAGNSQYYIDNLHSIHLWLQKYPSTLNQHRHQCGQATLHAILTFNCNNENINYWVIACLGII